MEIKGNVEFIEQCLKTTENFTNNIVHNICTGTQHVIPNGFWDYVGNFLLAGILIVLIGFIGTLVKKVIFD